MCDGDTSTVALNACRKVFIQRDYSRGLSVRFQTDFPEQLENWIDIRTWQDSVNELNRLYEEAEQVGRGSVAETVMGCLSCYTTRLCIPTQYEKKLTELSAYLDHQNKTVFMPRALFVTNPMERGLRVLEVSLLSMPTSTCQPMPHNNSSTAPILRSGSNNINKDL